MAAVQFVHRTGTIDAVERQFIYWEHFVSEGISNVFTEMHPPGEPLSVSPLHGSGVRTVHPVAQTNLSLTSICYVEHMPAHGDLMLIEEPLTESPKLGWSEGLHTNCGGGRLMMVHDDQVQTRWSIHLQRLTKKLVGGGSLVQFPELAWTMLMQNGKSLLVQLSLERLREVQWDFFERMTGCKRTNPDIDAIHLERNEEEKKTQMRLRRTEGYRKLFRSQTEPSVFFPVPDGVRRWF